MRRFARRGAAEELDFDSATIAATARNAGWLDLDDAPRAPQRGEGYFCYLDSAARWTTTSRSAEELFSACRLEFKHLEYFYFHNCVYQGVWRDNQRRHAERTPVFDVIHKYGPDYKLIFVGDATMSPYEILHPHGSVEHMNAEAGATWLRRLLNAYPGRCLAQPRARSACGLPNSIELIFTRSWPTGCTR